MMYESKFAGIAITQTRKLFYKTASGKSWKSKPETIATEQISAKQYICAVENRLHGDRYERGYTYAGYIPLKITSFRPDGNAKMVYEYSFKLVY